MAQTYQQAGRCGEAISTANELLSKDANNLNGLNVVLTCIFTMQGPYSADHYARLKRPATRCCRISTPCSPPTRSRRA